MAGPGSPDNVQWLRQELVRWQQQGLLSADQASRILAGYQGQETLVARTQIQARIVAVLGILGAILVGLGVILFFAANWQVMPRWSKFALVIVATAAAYSLGYWLRFARGYVGVGGAVLLLGGFLYGAGIFLVGQMFHVQAEPHYGLLLWAVGILPLGYVLPLKALIALSSLLLAAWALAVSVFGLDRYGISDQLMPVRILLGAGIVLYAVGQLHLRYTSARAFGRPYLVTGAIVVFLTYYVYTFLVTGGGWTSAGAVIPTPLRILEVGLAVAALALLLAHLALVPDRLNGLLEAGALSLLLITVWFTPPGVPVSNSARAVSGAEWLWIVISNLLFFGVSLGAAMLGVQRRDRSLVNVGLIFFALGVAARYIDIIGKLITTSLLFIGGGLLLLGGGWLLERTRRGLLSRMESGNGP